MSVGGRIIGTLNFGHHQPGFYTDAHARLVEPIADQLAIAVSRFQLLDDAQRRVGQLSEALQRALLPARLPKAPFTTIAATYRPADPEIKVGGDWYDAIQLPGDRLLLSIGDVAGHGVAAAAVMGQVRHVTRAYAVEGRPPAAILNAVNRLLHAAPDSLPVSLWLRPSIHSTATSSTAVPSSTRSHAARRRASYASTAWRRRVIAWRSSRETRV
jgi:hypothetical protein